MTCTRAALRALRVSDLGHGVEAHGGMFCRAHCAGKAGVSGVRDRA